MIRLLLVTVLAATLSAMQAEQPPPGMVLVPAGEFVMGCDDGAYDEAPAHRVQVSAFWLDRTEVTIAAFAAFVRESGSYDTLEGPWFRVSVEGCLDVLAHLEARYGETRRGVPAEDATEQERRCISTDGARRAAARSALEELLRGSEAPLTASLIELSAHPAVRAKIEAQARLPVRYVTWRDAAAYAQWAKKRLPTEAEWEKAARGADARAWPWGDEWSATRCRTGLAPRQAAVFDPYRSTSASTPTGPAPVGSLPEGESPCGAVDMAGNVWEWCADWYGERYYAAPDATRDPPGPSGLANGRLPEAWSNSALLRDGRQGREPNTRKVLRGGGWSGPPDRAAFDTRTTRRLWSNPGYWHADVGFRCAKDAAVLPATPGAEPRAE